MAVMCQSCPFTTDFPVKGGGIYPDERVSKTFLLFGGGGLSVIDSPHIHPSVKSNRCLTCSSKVEATLYGLLPALFDFQ